MTVDTVVSVFPSEFSHFSFTCRQHRVYIRLAYLKVLHIAIESLDLESENLVFDITLSKLTLKAQCPHL